MLMKTSFSPGLKTSAVLLLALLAPALAEAHPFHGQAHSFSAGFLHPLTGWDHILAMVAVGLWAAQMGGRALWLVPASFVSLMVVGGALGMMGVPVPFVEPGILASVLVLGLLIAGAVRLPVVASMALVGVFAVFHGHAHGAELVGAASNVSCAFGFVLATALLHGVGISLGLLARQKLPAPALRIAGAAIVLGGFCLLIAP